MHSLTLFLLFLTQRRKEDRDNRYLNVMRSLVWRYVSAMHRRYEESAVTEDDINEVKADISAMRYEILEVLERNGMDVSSAEKKESVHLAKRVKVWERRLMKDFHVAPVTGEEEPQENDKGLARFKRVAQQVAHNTTSHKWGVAVKGVTDTQIGRCRNRDSFRNQQNLARAMNEAKRLVNKSPVQKSGNCTPIEFYDPTGNTLLDLLKNISEEADEISPQNTVRSPHPSGSGVSPGGTLNNQLQALFANSSIAARSPAVSPVPARAPAVELKQMKSPEAKERKSVQSQPPVHAHVQRDPVSTPPRPSEPVVAPPKSPVPKVPVPKPQSPETTEKKADPAPPLISITRTDSSRTPKSKSKENLNEVEKDGGNAFP